MFQELKHLCFFVMAAHTEADAIDKLLSLSPELQKIVRGCWDKNNVVIMDHMFTPEVDRLITSHVEKDDEKKRKRVAEKVDGVAKKKKIEQQAAVATQAKASWQSEELQVMEVSNAREKEMKCCQQCCVCTGFHL